MGEIGCFSPVYMQNIPEYSRVYQTRYMSPWPHAIVVQLYYLKSILGRGYFWVFLTL